MVLLRLQRYFYLFIRVYQVLKIANYCSRLHKTNRKACRWYSNSFELQIILKIKIHDLLSVLHVERACELKVEISASFSASLRPKKRSFRPY